MRSPLAAPRARAVAKAKPATALRRARRGARLQHRRGRPRAGSAGGAGPDRPRPARHPGRCRPLHPHRRLPPAAHAGGARFRHPGRSARHLAPRRTLGRAGPRRAAAGRAGRHRHAVPGRARQGDRRKRLSARPRRDGERDHRDLSRPIPACGCIARSASAGRCTPAPAACCWRTRRRRCRPRCWPSACRASPPPRAPMPPGSPPTCSASARAAIWSPPTRWSPARSASPAPVRDASGQVVAVLSVSAPSMRMRPPRPRALVPQVMDAAAKLSQMLGDGAGAPQPKRAPEPAAVAAVPRWSEGGASAGPHSIFR